MGQENCGQMNEMFDFGYDEKGFSEDFAEEGRETEYGFDYDGYRMHKYDDYEGAVTVDIAVMKYEALIRHYAAKYASKGAEYEDLVQIGMEGIALFVPGHENDTGLSLYLKERVRGYILDGATRLRRLADYDNRVFVQNGDRLAAEDAGIDWATREKAMFQKLAEILNDKEMQTTELLYRGCSLRETGRRLCISHAAVIKRLERIRLKLAPHKTWFEDRIEITCMQS